MFTVVAPASTTRATTSARKSGSVRAASSAENSTSVHDSRAVRTASTACSNTCSREKRNLNSRWIGLVARNTWMRGFSASRSASHALPMSSRCARAGSHQVDDSERLQGFDEPVDLVLRSGALDGDAGGAEVDHARAEDVAHLHHLAAELCAELDERQLAHHDRRGGDVVHLDHVD